MFIQNLLYPTPPPHLAGTLRHSSSTPSMAGAPAGAAGSGGTGAQALPCSSSGSSPRQHGRQHSSALAALGADELRAQLLAAQQELMAAHTELRAARWVYGHVPLMEVAESQGQGQGGCTQGLQACCPSCVCMCPSCALLACSHGVFIRTVNQKRLPIGLSVHPSQHSTSPKPWRGL